MALLLWAVSVMALGPGGCRSNVAPSPTPESESPIAQRIVFTMDYAKAAYPGCGWTPWDQNDSWKAEHVEGAGPGGRDAIEMRQLSNLGARDYGGQFNWGWRENIEPSEHPGGVRRYYRWRMWFSTDSNFQGVSIDGEPSNITNKLLIIGQGCRTGRCRFILSYRTDRETRRIGYFRAQIDGGEDHVDTGSYERGHWLNVQVELTASSSESAADGGYRVWINNDAFARPTAARAGIVLHAANWGYVWFGAFNNDGLAAEGTHAFRHSGFEVAETFDNTWHRRGQ